MKNKDSMLCCVFGGWFGLHYFINKKVGMGIFYLLTGGIFGIGWFIDIIRIACTGENTNTTNNNNNNNYNYNKPLCNTQMHQKLNHNNCPVCNKKLTTANKSNANFSGYIICTNCIKIINSYRGGEIPTDHIYLEDLQKIVNDNAVSNSLWSNNHYDYKVRSIYEKGYVDYQHYYNSYNERKTNKITKDYVVFDTETTGLDPSFDKIIEISAIKYKNNQKIDEFSILINPQENISNFITNLTGIKQGDLNNKPIFTECINDFFNFIENYTLVAHNASYDIKMLQAECTRNNINMCNNKVIDTVTLAKRVIPKSCISNYKLTTLKEYFGINVKSHRALDDCITCAKVYQFYLEQSLINLKFVLNSNKNLEFKEQEIKKYNRLNSTNYKYEDKLLFDLETGEIIE